MRNRWKFLVPSFDTFFIRPLQQKKFAEVYTIPNKTNIKSLQSLHILTVIIRFSIFMFVINDYIYIIYTTLRDESSVMTNTDNNFLNTII